jgi:hypothetical protein
MNLNDQQSAIDAWIEERRDLLHDALAPKYWWERRRSLQAKLDCGCEWKPYVWKSCDEHAAILGED